MHTGNRKGLSEREGKPSGKLGDTWRKMEAEAASVLESKPQQGQETLVQLRPGLLDSRGPNLERMCEDVI